jgi:hypothetical protein
VLEGIKMNSCACLLDPKKIPMCVVLVWLFGDGCFCKQFYKFFLSQFAKFEPIFLFCKFVKVQ